MTTSARDEVKAAIEKMGNKISPKAKQMAEDAIVKIKEGMPPQEALGFTPAMMESIYKYGYNQFQSGKFDDALNVFSFLRQLEVGNYRYSFAIAACHQYRKEYSEAAANYILCTYFDPLNPVPCFHLYDCFIKLNQPLSALKAIKETIALAELHPHYSDLKEKALLEYKTFKKSLKKYLKENFDKENLDKHPLEEEGEEL